MEQLKDAEARINEFIRANPGTSRTESYERLRLGLWHHYFDSEHSPELTTWCRLFARAYHADRRTRESKRLKKTVEDPRFAVSYMPEKHRVTLMSEGHLFVDPVPRHWHAGLMVPFVVDHRRKICEYRRMYITRSASTDTVLHELAHAMERHRVNYSSNNHDGQFASFHSDLRAFYQENW